MNKSPMNAAAAVEKPMHTILVNSLPGIKAEMNVIGDKSCSYKVAAFFAIYTKKQIRSGNYHELKKCFHVADALVRLSTGDSRHAIENVFLFSLAMYLDKEPAIKTMLPHHLKKIYEKQLCAGL